MILLKDKTNQTAIPITVFSIVFYMGIGFFFWEWGLEVDFEIDVLGSSSRLAHGVLTGMLTVTAVVISLASNLYTPRLAKLYVKHPVVVGSVGFILFAHLILILDNLITPEHPWYRAVLSLSFFVSCLSVTVMLPFLYYVSQLLRPLFFMQGLKKVCVKGLNNLGKGTISEKSGIQVFDNIDVISNVTLTALKRDDRKLVILGLRILQDILNETINNVDKEENRWRYLLEGFYLPGLSIEGREFLKIKNCWPEAFILGKKIQILIALNETQQEIIPDECRHLRESLELCVTHKNHNLIEMHQMAFNTITRRALNKKNPGIFQSLSYNYRLLAVMLIKIPLQLHSVLSSWFYYAGLAKKNDIDFGYETVVYDSARLLLHIAGIEMKYAMDMYRYYIEEFWQNSVEKDGRIKQITIRASVIVYWEGRALGFDELSDIVRNKFLDNDDEHKDYLKGILSINSPMHWEFNDRFIRFTYLSDEAINESRSFYSYIDGLR